MTDTVDAFLNELNKQLSTFLLHTFVKRQQAASFDSLKNSCDGKSIVLQVDFSENVTIAAQKEVQAAHWHHSQATIFTTYTWIRKKYKQPTGTTLRQRSSPLTLGSKRSTSSPLAPRSDNDLHHLHLDQKEVQAAHWHHTQTTIFTTYTWIKKKYKQPTGTTLRQRSSPLTLGSKRSTSSPLAPHSGNDLHHLHLDQKEVQAAHWHHAQATIFTTYTWIRKKYKQPTGTTLRQRSSPLTLGSKRSTSSPLAPHSDNDLHHLHLDQKEVQAANWHHSQATIFTTYTWIRKKYKQPTGTTLRQRSSPLTLGSKRSTSSPLAPRSDNDLHHLHLDQKEVQAAHWHHTQATIFTTYTWIKKKYKQPTGTTLRQRSSPLTLGSERSTSSPLAPHSDNDLHHLHLDQKEVQAAHWHHAQATIFTTYTWIKKKYKQPTGTTLRQRSSPLTLGSERSTSSPLAPRSGNDLHHLHLDQKEVQAAHWHHTQTTIFTTYTWIKKKYKQPTGTTLRQRSSPLTLGSKRSTSSPLAPRSGNDLHHLHLDQKEVQAAHWHHTQTTIFTTYTWIKKKYKQPTGTTLRQRSSPLTLGSKRSTSSPLAPRSGNDLHHLHLDQKEVQAAHWHHTQATIFTTYTWIKKKYKQPTGTTLRQRSSPLTLGSKRSTSSPLAPHSGNDLHHLHLDQKEVQAAHWHHAQATIFTTYTWIKKKYKQPTGTTLRQRSSPLTLGSERSTSSPLAPHSGNDLHHLHLDQKEVQAAHWHHTQATIFTTYTWIKKKYKQPTGTTLRQRSSPLTLGSKRSTSSPLAPHSGNDLHHLHLDQKEVQAAHWHHTQTTIFTTYTWIKKKYKQPTGTTLRQRSSPLKLGSKRSTSSPLAPHSDNDLNHLHLDQKEVQAAHWHHAQATIFTTYTWIKKKYKQPTGTTLRQRSSPLTLGSTRSTSSPLAPRSDNDLHHLHLDQKEVQAAHWHHAQTTIFTTYTWIKKKYKQPTGTTLRQRSSPLTLGSKRSTSSPLVPHSDNDLHHLHLDQKEVQAAHWHHTQATIFTTYTWINKKYKQPTGTTLRQRSSPHTLGSKRSTSSPLAPRSGNDLHHLHLDQKEVQAAHWHHTQATIFTTYTWINKKYKQPTGTTLRQRSSPLTLGSKRSTSSPLAPHSGNDLHHLHLDQKEVQAAHWHHAQTTIFTTYTWIKKKYKQSTGTTLRQRSSPLTLGSKRSTSSPLAPRSDNDLHHLHLDQKEVQAAHWHHTQTTIFTTYTWIKKKYKQPTGTTLRQRSSPLTLGSKRSTSSPLAPHSGNDLHHLHLDQKEVQAAHWHHTQTTIFTTYTWIKKKYKQPTGTTLRQRSSPLTLGSKRSTSSPLAPRSGNDLHHLHLDQKEVQAAHWHHAQATIFTTYTWIRKKYKQSTGTTLRQRSSPLTLRSKRSTSSPLAPRSDNDLHHLHLDQKEVQAAHWHHTQATIFTTYTWIKKKYKQPTGTTLRQRSSPLTLGSKRSTSSPLAPHSGNDLHHIHLDQKEVQAAHWHHTQTTIFTTYTWIKKKYKQPTGTTLRQRSSPLTLGSKRSTSSPLAPHSGNDLHHLHLDQKEVQAAHWHHAQTTIFTTYTWIKKKYKQPTGTTLRQRSSPLTLGSKRSTSSPLAPRSGNDLHHLHLDQKEVQAVHWHHAQTTIFTTYT